MQAILVALITTSAGLAAGYIGRGGSASKSETTQRWLTIEKVTPLQTHHGLVHLIVTVNGINYSSPATALWTTLGPAMAVERLPLPATDASYHVSMRAFLADSGHIETYEAQSRTVDEVFVTQLPAKSRSYDLYELQSVVQNSNPNLTVRYSIE